VISPRKSLSCDVLEGSEQYQKLVNATRAVNECVDSAIEAIARDQRQTRLFALSKRFDSNPDFIHPTRFVVTDESRVIVELHLNSHRPLMQTHTCHALDTETCT
jgi:hypothetical protein